MKKIASILILVFAFTLTAQAQKKERRERRDHLTTEQKATLAVKKMTLALDLSERQQKQLKPVLMNQLVDRMTTRNKIKAMRESGKRPSDNEKFEMASANLDKKIAFKNNMKEILNNEQFEQFKEMTKKREGKRTKGMEQLRMKRRGPRERQ